MRVQGDPNPSANGVFYTLGDHLGSTSLITDSAGTKVAETRYMPWGETRYTSGYQPSDYLYTGQRAEAGIGLYYYNARWYDPYLNHFTQPDTLIQSPSSVQSYDRYSYTHNNPIKYVDPSGHLCQDIDIGGHVVNICASDPSKLPSVPGGEGRGPVSGADNLQLGVVAHNQHGNEMYTSLVSPNSDNNSCGPTALCSAVEAAGGMDFGACMAAVNKEIANNNVYGYGIKTGIQPSGLEKLARTLFPDLTITVIEGYNPDLYRLYILVNMQNGNIPIIDYRSEDYVNGNPYLESTGPHGFAHFVPITGYNPNGFTLAQVLNGQNMDVNWVNLSPSLEKPEVRAALMKLYPEIPEGITYWAMFISKP